MVAPDSVKAEALIRRGLAAPLEGDDAMDLAEAALASGHELEALPLVAAAAQRHGNHAALLQWTGLLHRSVDQHAQALTAFAGAAGLAPADPLLAHSLAQTTLEAGLPARALFDRALALAPNNDQILIGRAAARCAEGDYDGAIIELDQILAIHRDWVRGHELAMRLRWMIGQREDFAAGVENALAQAPQNPELWRLLIAQLIHADRFDEALDTVARARRAIGNHLFLAVNEAIALSELRRDREADEMFDQLERHRDISIAVRQMRHQLRTGRTEAAARTAEPWLSDPAANLIWPYLGFAWRMLGDSRWEWFEGNPDFIKTFDVTSMLPRLEELAELLRALHRVSAQPLDQSLRGGSQTDGHLFQRIDPCIGQLRAAMVEAVEHYVASLPPRDDDHPLLGPRRDRPIRFSGAWSVRLTDAGYHTNHNHPAGWISSAFYVVLPTSMAAAADKAGWISFGTPQRELGLDLPPFRTIEPKPGHLVLFPSTMWHGTLPFTSGERMTVAFDVAPPRP